MNLFSDSKKNRLIRFLLDKTKRKGTRNIKFNEQTTNNLTNNEFDAQKIIN